MPSFLFHTNNLICSCFFDIISTIVNQKFNGENLMIALKIITLVLGLAFTVFGYLIFFKGKHSLINDFEEQYKAGRKNEYYAKRVGFIELIIGIALLAIAIALMIVA